MKKRSLIASVAMLLVSAIVLSTSTYAWFMSGATVSVNQITATISASDDSIKIRATSLLDNNPNTDTVLAAINALDASYDFEEEDFAWSNTLDSTLIQALMKYSSATDFFAPTNGILKPITVVPGAAATDSTTGDTITGVYNNDSTHPFSMLGASTGSRTWDDDSDDTTPDVAVNTVTTKDDVSGTYLQYQFQIKANSACTINLMPTFTAAYKYIFAAVRVDNKTYVLSKQGEDITYTPITSTSTTFLDTDNNSIISSAEKKLGASDAVVAISGDLGSTVSAKNNANGSSCIIPLTYSESAGGVKTITVVIWAEGQQADCKGGAAQADSTLSFVAEKQSA